MSKIGKLMRKSIFIGFAGIALFTWEKFAIKKEMDIKPSKIFYMCLDGTKNWVDKMITMNETNNSVITDLINSVKDKFTNN
ncbi:Hypothetical protein KVN_LOCUS102 [uncultured virus]|nr:Hypothetical protein KVN_LOCUS102 [uncultured virus]